MIEMTREEIDALLSQVLIGRLALARAGEPYCIPMPFLYHEGALYFRLPLEGRKGEMLRANPRVCFEADVFSDDLSDYASVLAEGELLEVVDLQEKASVRETTSAKYQGLRRGNRPGHGRPLQPLELLPLRKLRIDVVSGRKKGRR